MILFCTGASDYVTHEIIACFFLTKQRTEHDKSVLFGTPMNNNFVSKTLTKNKLKCAVQIIIHSACTLKCSHLCVTTWTNHVSQVGQ